MSSVRDVVFLATRLRPSPTRGLSTQYLGRGLEPEKGRRRNRSTILGGTLLIAMATVSSAAPVLFEEKPGALAIRHEGGTLAVSLRCPKFNLDGVEVGGESPRQPACGGLGTRPVEITFAPIPLDDSARLEVRLLLRWYPRERVLRKWARYRLGGDRTPKLLSEVVLDETEVAGIRLHEGAVQSYPAFGNGFFLGIEFPVASTRIEGDQLLLAHRPGLRLRPRVWYETRKAVYGVASRGREREAFQRYIAANRPKPKGFHVNYNSWWTSPVPYSEADILKLMAAFEQRLFKQHGVSFDTFCIDMGWSDKHSLWGIDRKLFPDGFAPLQQAARRMNSNLGLWISPTSHYRDAMDNEWAKEQGYETYTAGQQRLCCLGGSKYQTAFRDRLVEMVTKYGVRHIKLDGYSLGCPQADHGHEPGPLSAEAIAEGGIAAFKAVRKAAPDVWLEATCFGWNPSPWWLFHVNSVIGTFGDDAPRGRVPSPVYRESYTTARDYFNLQGANWLPIPVAAQEVLGIVHQSPEPFLNDAIMTVMRGHMFLPAYINPAFMDDSRWKALASLLKWARKNATILEDTEPLLPNSWRDGRCPRFSDSDAMPREPYGYAHWQCGRGLVALRNPWIAPQSYALKIGCEGTGLSAVSIYPEPRVYGDGLRAGQELEVQLAPYETVVLDISRRRSLKGIPDVAEAVGRKIETRVVRQEVKRVEFQGQEQPFGPDWTSALGDATSAVRIRIESNVQVDAPRAELLILLEGDKPIALPTCRTIVNGEEHPMIATDSETGWSSTGLPTPEHWLFLCAPLVHGKNRINVEMFTGSDSAKVSAWVWATKEGGHAGLPIQGPETISLDAKPLVEPVDISSVSAEVEKLPRPIERIDGVFLDALEPVSVGQGWGSLQKNKSVWEKPMTIGAKRYLRGLGTHAPSRIVYALDGRYRRFQSWVGADAATNPTITFEVHVDGRKRWESGLMTRQDPAKLVDLDITGAKTVELIVGDGGNGLTADHANWAEAKVLR